jgi:signal transduction histidine kinase/ActR/RegA family two-component response regulator
MIDINNFFKKSIAIIAIAIWTIMMSILFIWNYLNQKEQINELAKKEADMAYYKDLLYREWGAIHGGVYVPITKYTQPNPYLEVEERDIETPKGKKLTLMNPAYMIRQVYDLAKKKYLIQGHITSLNPINPINKPDNWEIKALKLFEKGAKKYYEFFDNGKNSYLRAMRPFITQKPCLKCHEKQGYKIGDIRGGISITIPMNRYLFLLKHHTRFLFVSHVIIWILGIIAILVIIDRVRKHNNERKELLEKLYHSQKMEAIGKLAGGIAHDFNNLLTVINGYSEMALMKISENNSVYNKILAINEAGKKAENLTKQLLALSKKQIFKPEILDINDVIKSLDKILRRLMGEDINIQTIFKKNISFIKADKSQIEQIIINLTVNARDAVREIKTSGGQKKITIETGETFFDESILMKYPDINKKGLYVFFAVSDNGIGMNEEVKNRIFEPFFTTKEKDKGTGLGLATVYGIVKQNYGAIYVYTEQNKGSTFKIYWPATNEKSVNKKDFGIEVENYSGNENILIVEDDENVLEFASSALKSLGYKIYTASNGKEALKLIQTNDFDFDLIITDLIMPELNGKEFVEQLKEMDFDFKVIYVSGYTDNHIVHDGMLEEGINFIHKPYSISTLAKTIRLVLEKDTSI